MDNDVLMRLFRDYKVNYYEIYQIIIISYRELILHYTDDFNRNSIVNSIIVIDEPKVPTPESVLRLNWQQRGHECKNVWQ